MEDALRFAKYATAVYGSAFYTWMLKKKCARLMIDTHNPNSSPQPTQTSLTRNPRPSPSRRAFPSHAQKAPAPAPSSSDVASERTDLQPARFAAEGQGSMPVQDANTAELSRKCAARAVSSAHDRPSTKCQGPAAARRVKLPGPLGRWKVYYELLTARGWNAYKRNELNAEKITNMSLRLNYEAVVQYADIEDNDLLYFSYANQVRAGWSFTAAERGGAQWGVCVLLVSLTGDNVMAASMLAAPFDENGRTSLQTENSQIWVTLPW